MARKSRGGRKSAMPRGPNLDSQALKTKSLAKKVWVKKVNVAPIKPVIEQQQNSDVEGFQRALRP